ncbi:MAG TPA: ATP-binding protein [Allosphingosinicella sp.]|nr:ATP-binding protein [Allosphingosinicella sp.]
MTPASGLDRIERNAGNHLRLSLLGVVAQIVAIAEDPEALVAANPFLAERLADFARLLGGPVPTTAAWRGAVRQWRAGHDQLPLARLEAAGLGDLAIDLLLTLGFAEEDSRLAPLFGGDSARLTLGALDALWHGAEDEARDETVRGSLARLCDAGLAALVNRDKVRLEWEYAVEPALWDALGGITRLPPGMALVPAQLLPKGEHFVPPRPDFPDLGALAAALGADSGPVLCLRGPARNGRHMLAGCLLGLLGRPMLAVEERLLDDGAGWRLAGAVAAVARAGLAVELRLGAGEDRVLPALPFADVPLIAIAGVHGGVRSADRRPLVTVAVPMPAPAARAALWRRTGLDSVAGDVEALAANFRLTSGTIVRAAETALGQARLAGRDHIGSGDMRLAIRTLCDARLESVARRIEASDDPTFIALDDIAHEELAALAARCRHRETLAAGGVGANAGAGGVRALFAGPSGTGKTLAAHWLAHRLAKDLFRIDLAASVSKYIGETEKNLDRAFAAAEELDCILLLDEGDSLMTRRTEVGSANDRYANLETNFLLQRIEGYEGILLVTSNAPDRIDEAFARRMDVVVQFRQPDEVRRYEIFDRHLGAHAASDSLIQEIACRCALSGGQLRNVAVHARLLALDAGVPLGDAEVRAALLREYRKIDAHCPLKPHLAAAV